MLAEALLCGLVKPEQVTDILSLVSCRLETQSAEQQDLRLLLLSHLLGDVYQSYGPASEFSQRILGVVPRSCVQSDTQAALERLQHMSAGAPEPLKHVTHSVKHGNGVALSCCAPQQVGTLMETPFVHSPYSVLVWVP